MITVGDTSYFMDIIGLFSSNTAFLIVLATMGQMAIEISDSVWHMNQYKKISILFCQKNSYTCQITSLRAVTLTLFLLTAFNTIFSSYLFCQNLHDLR
jgi:hypothetical protein